MSRSTLRSPGRTRLWWGVGILIVFTILGVVVPLLVMATGPRDLAAVRWVLHPFVASLALLIGYIVVYLVQLTRHKPDDPRSPQRVGRPDRTRQVENLDGGQAEPEP